MRPMRLDPALRFLILVVVILLLNGCSLPHFGLVCHPTWFTSCTGSPPPMAPPCNDPRNPCPPPSQCSNSPGSKFPPCVPTHH